MLKTDKQCIAGQNSLGPRKNKDTQADPRDAESKERNVLTPVLARYNRGIFAASVSMAVLACSLPFLIAATSPTLHPISVYIFTQKDCSVSIQ